MASRSSYITQDISSLRAAALLTLRSRPKPRLLSRRTPPENPDDTSSIASTRKALASPELDYGSDDASPTNENYTQVDEGNTEGEKEEGEISDDETQRVAKQSFSMMDIDNEPLPGLSSVSGHNLTSNTSSVAMSEEVTYSSGLVQPGPSTSKLPPHSIFRSPTGSTPLSAEASLVPHSPQSRLGPMYPSPGPAYLNPEYIRPSLKMTAAEFAEAKEIILDLLGWNVPADYLIHCGLSREVIYYVFTELNLKLPDNIDTTGIIPYLPPEEAGQVMSQMTEQVKGQVAVPSTTSSQNTAVTPGLSYVHPVPISPSSLPATVKSLTTSPSRRSPQSPVTSNIIDMYSEPIPGLQNVPSSSHTIVPQTVVSDAPVTRPVAEFPKHGYSGNLDEIETLRRQELIARKAALASRRKVESKETINVSTSFSTTNGSRSLDSPLVSTEVVDNFLNSIASTTVTKDIAADVLMSNGEEQPPPPPTELPVAPDHQVHAPPKKPSNKRAVAADWIDNDTPSRDSPYPTMNGNGRPSNVPRPSNTSTPSFANLIPSRKVVIDFSDSEDDLVDDLPEATPLSVVVPVKITTTTSRRGTPEPANVTVVKQQQRHIPTPEALALKEREIRRMKELIAEREKTRLKNLSNPPKSATPPPAVPSAAISSSDTSIPAEVPRSGDKAGDLPVKQEFHITPPFSPHSENNGTSTNYDVQADYTMQDAPSADPQTAPAPLPFDSTPIDAVDNRMDNDLPVSATAVHEQVASVVPVADLSKPFPDTHPQDFRRDITSSHGTQFTDYISPLSIFPHPQKSFITDTKFRKNDARSSSPVSLPSFSVDRSLPEQIPDLLRPLYSETVSRLDPTRLICPFEIPGGGKCQDATCPHTHLRDFEPTDDEIAQYLSRILQTPQVSCQMIRTVLLRLRTSGQEIGLYSRVVQALDYLGVR